MNRKTVGVITSYNPGYQRDWLWHQSPNPLGVWGNIQMNSTAPNPDYLIMYQYDFPRTGHPVPWWKAWRKSSSAKPLDIPSLLRNVPKERIIYMLREPPLEKVIAVNQANYEAASQYCGYVTGPDRDAPHPDYMSATWFLPNSFCELNDRPIPEKTLRCSWVTSGILRSANHRQRLNFMKLGQDLGWDVDLYGKDLPDWSQAYGLIKNKWNVMGPYYYNLAIENFAENEWYVSEKLWDALLAWCLPIYHGGSAADKLLPPGSFLRLPSLDEKGVAYIREVTSTLDAWHEARDAIAEARQIILHKLNLLEWLSNFVAKSS
ncbi:glycosyltransferase family 10 domain-containing protein [Microcystis aeruginosa]|uniref:Fucosyltransferase C-terminal domain-containing protein n=1 Tax=Microcystis aeruginosa NIES-2521 TaxID=2303983 RepID=A0A5A5S5L7_MICAE|nr:glycosyltransferase family 10 [Microcystis aeruginosa]GCA79866.1 hypothetical protein MiTs_01865 [Microcystis aeruginosa NIES-2521]